MSKKQEPVVVSAYSDMPDRVIFTEEMRETHTILIPNMLPRHFKIISQVLNILPCRPFRMVCGASSKPLSSDNAREKLSGRY